MRALVAQKIVRVQAKAKSPFVLEMRRVPVGGKGVVVFTVS